MANTNFSTFTPIKPINVENANKTMENFIEINPASFTNLKKIKLPVDMAYNIYLEEHRFTDYSKEEHLKFIFDNARIENYNDFEKIHQLFNNKFTDKDFYKITINNLCKMEIDNKKEILDEIFKNFFNEEEPCFDDICERIEILKNNDFPEKSEIIKNITNNNIEHLFELVKCSDFKYPFCENDIDIFLKYALSKDLDTDNIKLTLKILQNFDIANKEDILKEYLFKVSEKADILPDDVFEEIDQKYFGNFINDNLDFFASSERITNTLKFIKKLDYENKDIALGKIFNIYLNSPGYNINTFFDIVLKNDVKKNIDLLDEKNKIITFKVAYENNNAKIEMIKENENGFDVKNLLTINATPNEINNYLVENIIESIPKKHESSGFMIDVQDKDFFYITKKPELLKNISETADKKYFVDHNNLYVMQSKEKFNNFDNYQNKKTSSLQSLTAIFTMNAEKIKHFDVLQVKNEEEIVPINKKEEIINKINEYATKYSSLCEKISSDDNLENDEFKDLINNNLIKSIKNFLDVANEDIISQEYAENVFKALDKHFSVINKSITTFSLMSSQKFEFNNETKEMLNKQKENTKAIILNVSKEIEDNINSAFFYASLDQSSTIAAYNILMKKDNDFIAENLQK